VIWTEKRPKGPNTNLVKLARGAWAARVRLKLPDGRSSERERTCTTKTEARRLRDEMYAAYNTLAFEIVAGTDSPSVPDREPLTLRALSEKCRDVWWPAKGRSADIADQYFQKIETYCYPVLGEDRLISTITPDDWDAILLSLHYVVSERYGPLSSSTIRKVKACLSSALSCAVARKYLDVNPIKGLPYNPNPLAESDRLGTNAEALPDEEAPAKRMLSDKEALAILAKAKGTLAYPMIVLPLGFGLRIAEALAVKWSDIDAESGELKVRFQVKRRKNTRSDGESPKTKSVLERVAVLKSKSGKWAYWPFGQTVSRTGSNPTPFQFCGTLGYFSGNLSQFYVRARYLFA
jgi:integrase